MSTDTDKKPICYIIRARFQPFLRQHYMAIRDLIILKRDRFAHNAKKAAYSDVVMLLVICSVAKKMPAKTAKNINTFRHWSQFNPLSGAETVHQLEIALWDHLDEDASLSSDDHSFLRDAFRNSVFPVHIPVELKVASQIIKEKVKQPSRKGTPIEDAVIHSLGILDDLGGPYHACWTFPLLDNSDKKDAQQICTDLKKEILKFSEGFSGPSILLGIFGEHTLKAISIVEQNTRIGTYGAIMIHKLSELDQNIKLEEIFHFSEDQLPVQVRKFKDELDAIESICVCNHASTYMRTRTNKSARIPINDDEEGRLTLMFREATEEALGAVAWGTELQILAEARKWLSESAVGFYRISDGLLGDYQSFKKSLANIVSWNILETASDISDCDLELYAWLKSAITHRKEHKSIYFPRCWKATRVLHTIAGKFLGMSEMGISAMSYRDFPTLVNDIAGILNNRNILVQEFLDMWVNMISPSKKP